MTTINKRVAQLEAQHTARRRAGQTDVEAQLAAMTDEQLQRYVDMLENGFGGTRSINHGDD